MARDAGTRGDEGPYTVIIVAVVIGTAAPLVIAYMVHRLHAGEDPTAEDAISFLEVEGLVDWEAGREFPAGSIGSDGKEAALPAGEDEQDE
jgi:hypothetical protein